MLIKCKQCGLQVPAGIYRLKLHIAGIRGQVIVLAWCRSPGKSPDSTFRMKW
ncbi:hypothetical protein PVAP13_4KG146681 [Panicum virgatum]|uniref:Uncharacterized protein n=1 Tax=Panicum virgatum TaxID=38727 RepID=A0A8T0TI25_PANVG|nr:hypothetical protein PVAP13_4KG146681 [Panicum virgatum]